MRVASAEERIAELEEKVEELEGVIEGLNDIIETQQEALEVLAKDWLQVCEYLGFYPSMELSQTVTKPTSPMFGKMR